MGRVSGRDLQIKKSQAKAVKNRQAEEGFALVGLVVAIFIILLFLAMAAPRVAQDLRQRLALTLTGSGVAVRFPSYTRISGGHCSE